MICLPLDSLPSLSRVIRRDIETAVEKGSDMLQLPPRLGVNLSVFDAPSYSVPVKLHTIHSNTVRSYLILIAGSDISSRSFPLFDLQGKNKQLRFARQNRKNVTRTEQILFTCGETWVHKH